MGKRLQRSWPRGVLGVAILATLIVGARYVIAPAVSPVKVHLVDYYPEYQSGELTLPDGTAIHMLIADTSKRQEQGLSGVASLLPSEGMLFAFAQDDIYTFWMKDMLIPIDMIWLSADKRIVHVEAHAQPASYPLTFTPPVEARYVLEVADGFTEEHHLAVGQTLQF